MKLSPKTGMLAFYDTKGYQNYLSHTNSSV